MSEAPQIEILPEDETTIWGYKELKKHGHGAKSTVDRKVKKKTFPPALVDDGGKKGWSVAQIKRHLQKKMDRLNQSQAA